ncbi:hypothetical protein CERSUDRAFT_83086 [Gelatoporia subvermispora B]|uniref:GST N-terminal domain-containing protein n=1 Tax=Ceriporiopsis subvermispora (strain B) TaxID=914234 RepID=M2PLR9_CERS8|nr:hypothetical protein CERSUDRAFT_83086 [Gelatoporia subvermispora B]
MPEQITLYGSYISPFSHMVNIALLESKADFNRFEIDLRNKPDFFVREINPVGKVPVIAYGGPIVPLDRPSPESVKLTESRVLLDFIADLFPDAGLLPKDPVLRAKAHFFIDVVQTKLIPAWRGYFAEGKPSESLLTALEEVQALLPPSGYAIGEWSIADASIVPILARMDVVIELDHPFCGWREGEARSVLDTIHGPRFARLRQFYLHLAERPVFQATFDKDIIKETFKGVFDFRLQLRQSASK